ncbi:unnamed protein product [Vitrella brassicaformis CCMP3155]|uniref:Nickel/cobalt efflux system n=2 Tax=Vitrella brassicaformis TaxID=1169539 RepID=A0A0G4EB05_VITBC|nr:unnamed protein product [Vitrella brassicaformis CCMP3155]|eukprot:CEL92650.1 unnamed protein product [Vitrella brassicaformis CCMP3155]
MMLYRAILTSVLSGIAHVLTGPDHVSAIITICVRKRFKAFYYGIRWGIGHSIGLLLVGLVLWGLRSQHHQSAKGHHRGTGLVSPLLDDIINYIAGAAMVVFSLVYAVQSWRELRTDKGDICGGVVAGSGGDDVALEALATGGEDMCVERGVEEDARTLHVVNGESHVSHHHHDNGKGGGSGGGEAVEMAMASGGWLSRIRENIHLPLGGDCTHPSYVYGAVALGTDTNSPCDADPAKQHERDPWSPQQQLQLQQQPQLLGPPGAYRTLPEDDHGAATSWAVSQAAASDSASTPLSSTTHTPVNRSPRVIGNQAPLADDGWPDGDGNGEIKGGDMGRRDGESAVTMATRHGDEDGGEGEGGGESSTSCTPTTSSTSSSSEGTRDDHPHHTPPEWHLSNEADAPPEESRRPLELPMLTRHGHGESDNDSPTTPTQESGRSSVALPMVMQPLSHPHPLSHSHPHGHWWEGHGHGHHRHLGDSTTTSAVTSSSRGAGGMLQKVTAVCMGILHGVAGPGGLLGLLPASKFADPLDGLVYLCLFLLVTTLTMGFLAAAYGEMTYRVSINRWRFAVFIHVFSCLASFVVGFLWIVLTANGTLNQMFG